ncbi:MAG: Mrp/NBP35 family ATP-binding protein [Candidatus Margulisbacteria bacterium]|nr:Mrp/NBP35 family ATP-binding protein [Candidatus Margulisiibacteriota bacterium]
MDNIKNKIMIMSNKGGVGKSTVTADIAALLTARGYKTGVMDIDLHGPSQAKLFGLDNVRHTSNKEGKIMPFKTKSGINIITVAGLLENDSQPLIWRGPLKTGIIKRFIKDVIWDEDLDYLLIDSPPGTGDEPLTIGQLIPGLDGIVIVTTPQEMAIIDSKKAINFANAINVPILGLIENMSGLKCPHCGELIDLFKIGGGQRIAKEMNIDVLGVLPFESLIMESAEKGKSFVVEGKTPAADEFRKIVTTIETKLKK